MTHRFTIGFAAAVLVTFGAAACSGDDRPDSVYIEGDWTVVNMVPGRGMRLVLTPANKFELYSPGGELLDAGMWQYEMYNTARFYGDTFCGDEYGVGGTYFIEYDGDAARPTSLHFLPKFESCTTRAEALMSKVWG